MGFGVPLWEDGFTEAGRWSRGPPDWGTVEGAAVGCCGAQSQQAAGAAGPPQGHRCAAASQPQLFSVPPGWGAHPHPCGEELRLCGGRSRPCLARPLYPAGRPKPHSCAAPWERAHTLAGLGFSVPWSQVRPPRPGASGRERAAGAGSAQVSLGPTGATNARCHTPRGTPALPAPLSLQLPLEGGPCSLRP